MCSRIHHKQKPISSHKTGAWDVGIQMQLREMYRKFCIARGKRQPLSNDAPTNGMSALPENDSRQMHWSAHKGTAQCGQRGHLRYVRTNIRNKSEASEPLPQSPSGACPITMWHLQALVNALLLIRSRPHTISLNYTVAGWSTGTRWRDICCGMCKDHRNVQFVVTSRPIGKRWVNTSKLTIRRERNVSSALRVAKAVATKWVFW